MKKLDTLHPLTCFLYFAAVLIITMFRSHPLLLMQAFVAGILYQWILEKKWMGTVLRNYFFLTILLGLVNPFITHNGVTVLFYMNGKQMTLEAFLYGLNMGVMLSAALVWFRCFSIVMTRDKLLCLFHRVPKLACVLTMAFRFIPMFRKKYESIKNTQIVMGNIRSDTYKEQVKGALSVSSILVTWSLENGIDTADSMNARGYGLSGRTRFSLFHYTWTDWIVLGITGLCSILLIKGLGSGNMEFTFYPAITKISITIETISYYIAHIILAFLPILLEIKEAVKWKYYEWKM